MQQVPLDVAVGVSERQVGEWLRAFARASQVELGAAVGSHAEAQLRQSFNRQLVERGNPLVHERRRAERVGDAGHDALVEVVDPAVAAVQAKPSSCHVRLPAVCKKLGARANVAVGSEPQLERVERDWHGATGPADWVVERLCRAPGHARRDEDGHQHLRGGGSAPQSAGSVSGESCELDDEGCDGDGGVRPNRTICALRHIFPAIGRRSRRGSRARGLAEGALGCGNGAPGCIGCDDRRKARGIAERIDSGFCTSWTSGDGVREAAGQHRQQPTAHPSQRRAAGQGCT